MFFSLYIAIQTSGQFPLPAMLSLVELTPPPELNDNLGTCSLSGGPHIVPPVAVAP